MKKLALFTKKEIKEMIDEVMSDYLDHHKIQYSQLLVTKEKDDYVVYVDIECEKELN